MACGECGDPRNLCRCSITSGDSSVIITGDGSDGNPFVITAPGAGSGTRSNDRAGVYDNSGSGIYPEIPPDYGNYDFYGPADPTTVPGYVPYQFDGWYKATADAPIALKSSLIVEETIAPTDTVLTVNMPEVNDGDVAILTVGAAHGTAPVSPPGWAAINSANSVFTGAWFRNLKKTDSGTSHSFSGMVAPFGGYLEIYSGVATQVLDVAGIAASSGDALVDHLDVPALNIATTGSLLMSACTIGAPTPALVPPDQMSTVNGSAGLAFRHMVATVSGGGGGKTWTHTPSSPGQQYSAVMFALRPAVTITYYLWINGRWVPVGGVGSGGNADYVTTIGDGVHSTFTVVHPLGSTDLMVECVNLATGQTCWPVIRRTTADNVYLDFGDTTPDPGSRRVLISRVGDGQGSGGGSTGQPIEGSQPAAPPWITAWPLNFLNEQMLPIQRPLLKDGITLDRQYPVEYSGPVGGSFILPRQTVALPTAPGSGITISDPGDLMPDYRGMVFGQVTLANPATYRVQGGKVTDAFYPFGPLATPDAGGFFAVDLNAVETWRKGPWAFRLETAAAPGVQVGGLWPLGTVYTGLKVELHAIADSDYLVSSQQAQVSGKVDFFSSTPGIKRLTLRDTGTNAIIADTNPLTGNIRSYLVSPGQPGYGTRFPEQCYVYDQAVALCAAVAAGDRELSQQLMQGIARLQTTTGAQTGGFRFSGRQGSAEYGDPAYRTGAHALATHAVLAYLQAYPQDAAAAQPVAVRGLTWLASMLATSGNRQGLYLGGVGTYVSDGGGGQSLDENYNVTWASTEHNIDAYFCLKLAGRILGGTYAASADALGATMWSKLWNPGLQRLNQGLQDVGPDTADPLDVHSWGSIFLQATGHTAEAVATMADNQLAPFKFTRTAPNGKAVTGYATAYDSPGYPAMVPHVWWEGTFSVAYAMSKLAQYDRQRRTVADCDPAQWPDGSYPYVSDYDPTYELVPYRSVASTGWAILAQVGGGIFDLGAI